TNYVDRHSGNQNNRTISQVGGGNPTYDVPCMKIQKNQKVEWDMPFNTFPLVPFGGDTPNPIVSVSTGSTTQVQFPTQGTHGFQSPGHPDLVGAIQVTN